MATIYVPSATGWQESHGNNYYVRLKVEQTYNSSTNTSSIVVTPQYCGSTGSKSAYNNSYVRFDGTELTPTINNQSFQVDYGSTWTDIRASAWTKSVAHGSDGTKSISVSVYFLITGGQAWENTATLTLSGTPTYTVSYSANGGSSTPQSQTKTYGVAINLAAAISRGSASAGSYTVTLNANGGSVSPTSKAAARTTAYSFRKWKSTGGTEYSAGASYTADESTTMTAQWNSSTTTAAVSLPTPSRTGYTFKGWNTDSSASTGVTGNYTPSGNVTLYAIWQKNSYTLSISAGTGSSITVMRGTTSLSNGATIYYGDSLTITVSANTGYQNARVTVNSSSFTSGDTHTVTGNVSAVSSATLTTYTLSVATNAGITLNVIRTASPIGGGASGLLSNGATLYRNDVLSVSYSVAGGYQLDTATVNGSAVSSSPYTVSSNMAVVVLAEVGAMVYIGGETYQAYIYNGSSWEQYQAYIYNGSSWVAY